MPPDKDDVTQQTGGKPNATDGQNVPNSGDSETSAVTAPIDFQIEGETCLGRYELRHRLGAGGMGEVYRAWDPLLQRSVAIKVIGQLVRDQAQMPERFAQEARAASALNHPNIVTVYDLGQQKGHPFIVMELVEGKTLQDRLAEPFSVEEIVRFATQIASGLAAAHEAGIVHRDLKPGNILIDRRDTVRILDFGVAAFRENQLEDEELGAENEPTALMTSPSGRIVGTVGYMAPEALRGQRVDHRADQFAFGVVLYEMATGTRPFRRPSRAEVLVATLEEEPEPLSALRKDLPAALRQIIERCLAKEPEQRYADTSEIVQALRAVSSTPPRESGKRRGLIPTPATPLWGREKELRQLRQLLHEGRIRLLTLTGVGGSGKTRLAIEVAREAQSEFPGGVVFVSLGTIEDNDLVAPAIAAAFGGTEASAGKDLPELLAALTESEGRMLLVVDNFEQVIGAASVVGELLQRCPDLTILATSREVLHLRAEQGFPVTPLPVPSAAAHLSLEAIREVPAVALFVERAQAAKPDFDLTEKNAQAVLEFCRRLDGLPLALELAAARVRTLPLRAMLQRLEGSMELLTGGPRDLPARQQTLRATLQWSFELLDESEQTAFRRLAAFVGGFSLEAAEAVVDPFGNLDRSVVDLVESLHDQSLLQRMPEVDDEPRFTMLEIIRDYAAELLRGSSDEQATRRAHAAYYLILAEEGELALNAGQSAEWIERFELEEANFRAALQWLIEEDDADWGLRMALGLFRYWELGEGRAEGQRRFAQLLTLPSAQGDSVLRAKGLFAAGVLSDYLQDRESDIKTIVECHEEALAISRRLGNPLGQAVALNALGITYADRGYYDKAHEYYEECMELWKELGESDAYARSLSNFANVLRLEGELERSRQLYRESADAFRRLGDPESAAWEVNHEAAVAGDQNDPAAAELYESALASFQKLGEPWGIATTLLDLGSLKHREGKLEVAGGLYRQALRLFCSVGHQRGVARVLEALAALAGAQEDNTQALRLAGAAEGMRKRLGNPPIDPWIRTVLNDAVASARACLDAGAGKSAWERGMEEPVDQLVDELCGD